MDAMIARHYAHYPLAALPGFVRAALARQWRGRADVLYLEARDEAGRFCGFVFAQSLGARPWRQLLARPRWTLPFAAFARARRFWHQSRNPVAPPPAIDRVANGPAAEDRPFTTVEYLFVAPEARGQGIAARLLDRVETECRAAGQGPLRAWISEFNPASAAAFRKAGWDVRQASTNKLIATRET